MPNKSGTFAMTDDIITSYNDLTDKPSIPTKTSDLTNDSGFITLAALTSYVTTTQLEDALDDYALKTDIPTDVSELNNDAGYATETWVENQRYSTFSGSYNDLTNKPDLSVYELKSEAFSGDYNDLSNKPDIPARVKSPFLGVKQDSDGLVLFSESGIGNDFYKIVDVTSPVKVNLHALNPKFGTGLTSSYDSNYGELNVAVDTTTVALKTDIPTVNNPTITFTQGGVSKGSITLNQSSNQTIALDTGGSNYTAGSGIDITNDVISVDNTVALKTDIPTNYVTTNTTQAVSGDKTFTGVFYVSSNNPVTIESSPGIAFKSNNKPTWNNGIATYSLATTSDIPTVNNPTITFTQGGVTKGSFTLNQYSNQTINVDDVPGMIGEVLYDVPNGEAGVNPITMAHSFADYSYVDIQYRNYDNAYEVKSVRVYDPNGKHVYLDWDVLASGAVYAKKSIYELSGNTMTVRNGSDMQVWYSNGSNMQTQATATSSYQYQIKITKVIGYKANSSALTTEQWTFTLQDGTTVTKKIVIA